MKIRTHVAWLILAFGVIAEAGAGVVHTISAEEWARPRHGERLVRLPALRQTMQLWMQHPDRRILIAYPGGEDGVIWAGELRAWLIALGVASSHIELQPGTRREDIIELTVIRTRENSY